MTSISSARLWDCFENTHKPPSMEMLNNCILRSLDTWSCHRSGVGRHKVEISVSTLKEPMIINIRLTWMQVGFSTVGS